MSWPQSVVATLGRPQGFSWTTCGNGTQNEEIQISKAIPIEFMLLRTCGQLNWEDQKVIPRLLALSNFFPTGLGLGHPELYCLTSKDRN